MTEELQKEMEELNQLGYRVKSKKVKYIYSRGECIGKKIFFDIEKKVMEPINQ